MSNSYVPFSAVVVSFAFPVVLSTIISPVFAFNKITFIPLNNCSVDSLEPFIFTSSHAVPFILYVFISSGVSGVLGVLGVDGLFGSSGVVGVSGVFGSSDCSIVFVTILDFISPIFSPVNTNTLSADTSFRSFGISPANTSISIVNFSPAFKLCFNDTSLLPTENADFAPSFFE